MTCCRPGRRRRRTFSSSSPGCAARSRPPGRCSCRCATRSTRSPESRSPRCRWSKLHCTSLGTRVAATCVELLGPDGDLVALGAERRLRDAKIAEIYDGTNQIQSMLVARDIRLTAEAAACASR